MSLYGHQDNEKYTELKNALNNEVIDNYNEYVNYFVDKPNKFTQQKLVINCMIDYISNKKWNQDLVDIVPIIISKITKHRLIVFEIIDDYFYEHDQTYSKEFTQCIYLKLDSQHYQSITKHPDLELTNQSQLKKILNETDSTDININKKNNNNGTDTNKNCLKYKEKSSKKEIKTESLELVENITTTNKNYNLNITNQEVISNNISTPKKKYRNSSGSPKPKKRKNENVLKYEFYHETSLEEKEIKEDFDSALNIFNNMNATYTQINNKKDITDTENKKKEVESSIFTRLKKLHSQYKEIDSQKVNIGLYGGNFDNFLI